MNSDRSKILAFINSYISANEAQKKLKRVQKLANMEGVRRSQARNQQIRNLNSLKSNLINRRTRLYVDAFPLQYPVGNRYQMGSNETRQMVRQMVSRPKEYITDINALRRLILAKRAAKRFKEQLGRPRNDDLKKFLTRKHHELVHKKNEQALGDLSETPAGKWLSGLPPEMQLEIARRFRWPIYNNNQELRHKSIYGTK